MLKSSFYNLQINEEYIKEELSKNLFIYINNYYDINNKKRLYVYTNEFKFIFQWFMNKFYEEKQKIEKYYSDFYCYIYLNIEDLEKRELYLNYIDSFDCDKTIDYREYIYSFFVSMYNLMRFELDVLKYSLKFNELFKLLKSGKIKIKMIPDYHEEYNKIKEIENNFNSDSHNEQMDEDEEISNLSKKIFNNLNLTFYDIICFYSDNGLSNHVQLYGFWILLRYFNEISDLNNTHFPIKPKDDLKNYNDEYLSLLLAMDNFTLNENVDDNDISYSFISYYISFRQFYDFETEHVLDEEASQFIKNLFEPEIQLFEKRLVEKNIHLIPLTNNFDLEDYIYFLRDLLYLKSKELKILYFKNLHSYELTNIMKMNYLNIFIRCINDGKYFTIKNHENGTIEYYYYDKPNREKTVIELNDWILKIKNEFFTIDSFIENYAKEIMLNFLNHLYENIRSNTHTVGECSICINDTIENEKNMFCTVCRHVYHYQCINEWFNEQHSKNIKIKSCPLCRNNMYSTMFTNYELYHTIYQLLLSN